MARSHDAAVAFGKPAIAFVLPSFAVGGAERVVLNLARLVDRSRFQPLILALDPRGGLLDDVPEDIKVVGLHRPRLRQALPALVAELRRLRPVVIFSTFTHINLLLLASRPFLRNARIVIREANMPSFNLARMPWPAAFRTACGWLYPSADAVIASSMRMRDEMIAMGIAPSKVHLLHNPVDEDRVRQSAQPVLRHEGKGVRYVAVGRLVRQKGFDRLLDAMAVMADDCHCIILGDGPERSALQEQMARLNLKTRVTFAGFVANPAPWIAGADAFLMPSRFEGMPNAALEAFALGTPVIATPEAGGISEVDGVIIAHAGAPFAAAMKAVAPRPSATLRASALPAAFRMDQVTHQLAELFKTGAH